MPEVVTEAIVVIDLVESTLTSNLFGWYAVGRHSLRDLRTLIGEVGESRGLRCMRSTGDGYLLTFYDPQSAEMAAIRAVEAVFELLRRILMRNREVSEERALNLRCAVHLGEVDVVPNDREGPHVSMAFRIEEISRASLPESDPARAVSVAELCALQRRGRGHPVAARNAPGDRQHRAAEIEGLSRLARGIPSAARVAPDR
jgi:class 3 adenylate cyclase